MRWTTVNTCVRLIGVGRIALIAIGTAHAQSAEDPALLAEDPMEILRAADRARGHHDGISWTVSVTAEERGRTTRETLHIRAAGLNVLAVTLAPPNRRGNTLLLNDGKVWFHKPGLSRPVPISQRQRLLGLASYGDIATTDYANQYEAHALPDQDLDGEACHVFDLRARTRGMMYDRIVWWVSKTRRVGLRADYFTLSGKPIKSARLWYDHVVPLADGTVQRFCSRMVIHEEWAGDDRTTLELAPPVLEPIPHSIFNLNRMGE